MKSSLKMCLGLVVLLICMLSGNASLERENNEVNNLANHKLSGVIQWKYEKRPFCNAFTGCGRKRTSYPSYPPFSLIKRNELEEKPYNNEYLSEGLSDLIDINAEPAVENVQKQIMSQAKIFEAIKEASKEIFRQKSNRQKMLENGQRLQMQEERENI
ncbi:GL23784 [Drosophila persimilis]|uniref:Cardioactive peptide n=2 Tax=pseudoobscura subgroup TaxID=32358 RepID=A0A6I8VUQ7_DROPS|nr:cardioactive peptide [Drosophila persimilis]XP_033234807.1 cardioactive peptide [Drosophila pseudoobscura]EDW23746.1 GL23784 [Drosophila persimilis]